MPGQSGKMSTFYMDRVVFTTNFEPKNAFFHNFPIDKAAKSVSFCNSVLLYCADLSLTFFFPIGANLEGRHAAIRGFSSEVCN